MTLNGQQFTASGLKFIYYSSSGQGGSAPRIPLLQIQLLLALVLCRPTQVHPRALKLLRKINLENWLRLLMMSSVSPLVAL